MRRVTLSKQAKRDDVRQPAVLPPASRLESKEPASVVPPVLDAGEPLDHGSRAQLGDALGFDFGRVRIHADAAAARSADALNASAYTSGDHIVFGAGQYQPGTPRGTRLLAHEAFHAAHQQTSQRLIPGVSPPDSAGERAAEQFANTFMNGRGSSAPTTAPKPEQAGPAWQIHPALRVTSPGTEVHHGDVGAEKGVAVGGVSVRTGEAIEVAPGRTYPNVIALEYSGLLSADSRWLQFVWFEALANTAGGVVASSGNVATSSGTKPYTTNASSPVWSVDSASTTDPFYDATGAAIRTASAITMFDAAGGPSFAPLATQIFNTMAGVGWVTFTAHFQTYLIQRGTTAYQVHYSTSTTYAKGAGGAVVAGPLGYTIDAASGPATAVPANLLAILKAGYPAQTVH